MSNVWYYQVMGETVGPLTSKELRGCARNGKIDRDTLIRAVGDEEWISADRFAGLFEDVMDPASLVPQGDPGGVDLGAPERPETGGAPAQASSRLIACPDCGGTISARAISCPHCGCPATAFAPESTGRSDPNVVIFASVPNGYATEGERVNLISSIAPTTRSRTKAIILLGMGILAAVFLVGIQIRASRNAAEAEEREDRRVLEDLRGNLESAIARRTTAHDRVEMVCNGIRRYFSRMLEITDKNHREWYRSEHKKLTSLVFQFCLCFARESSSEYELENFMKHNSKGRSLNSFYSLNEIQNQEVLPLAMKLEFLKQRNRGLGLEP